MRITVLLIAALALPLMACTDAAPASAADDAKKEAKPTIPEVSVEKAEALLKDGGVAVDANSKRTREKHGVVPNAVILSSSAKYDLAELPSDKTKELIFYCSNTYCTASDTAAERAEANGYKKVHVMREGIKGWKDSGKPVKSYPAS